MSLRCTAILLVFCVGAVACDKKSPGQDKSKATAPADGVRRIAIEVTKKGYKPGSTKASGGEKINLVFTRTEDTECGRYIKVQGVEGQSELPINQPVTIPVVMPKTGELVFTCGMDMMRGVVAVTSE